VPVIRVRRRYRTRYSIAVVWARRASATQKKMLGRCNWQWHNCQLLIHTHMLHTQSYETDGASFSILGEHSARPGSLELRLFSSLLLQFEPAVMISEALPLGDVWLVACHSTVENILCRATARTLLPTNFSLKVKPSVQFVIPSLHENSPQLDSLGLSVCESIVMNTSVLVILKLNFLVWHSSVIKL
jgi:hypothetical protein